MSDPSEQQQVQRTWDHPEGASFEDWMDSRVACFSTRRYDWSALESQADLDPRYRHTQMRYPGTGGMGVAANTNTMSVEHFTFSTMAIPAGHEDPSHLHTDVEEVFFIIRGKLKLVLEKDGERYETILTDRDLVSAPPGAYHEEINIGDEGALMCAMFSTKKSVTPMYPPEYSLAKIKR